MGQREPLEWDDQMLIWGEDAAWACHQHELHARLHRAQGRSILKAEQWAALDRQGFEDPLLAFQYDRFLPGQPRFTRGQ